MHRAISSGRMRPALTGQKVGGEKTMARNRRFRTAAIRFGPALKAFGLCLLIGGSGVGYVWQKNQIFELARQIKKRETRMEELETQNERLRKQLGMMRSPEFLEWRINKDLKLGLVAPQPASVWRLREPERQDAPPPRPMQPQPPAPPARPYAVQHRNTMITDR